MKSNQFITFLFFCISVSIFGQQPPSITLQPNVTAEVVIPLTVTGGDVLFPTLRRPSTGNRFFMLKGDVTVHSSTTNDGAADLITNDYAPNGQQVSDIVLDGLVSTDVNYKLVVTGGNNIGAAFIDLSGVQDPNNKLRFYPRMYTSQTATLKPFTGFTRNNGELSGLITLDASGAGALSFAGNIRVAYDTPYDEYTAQIDIEFYY